MTKKLLVGFLMLVMLLSVAGCGGTSSDGGAKKEASTGLPEIEVTSDKVTYLCWENKNALKDETSWWYKINELLKENYNCELQFITASYDNLSSKLTNMVLSGQSPDLVVFREADLVKFPKNNLVAETGELFDYESDLWKGLDDISSQFEYNGKRYLVPTYSKNDSYLYYWKSMFTDSGLSTPLEMYKNGELTLSNFQQLLKEVTIDSNRDGVVDIYGLTVHPAEIHGCTNTDFVTVNADGKYVNNLRSQGHNQFAEFLYNTGSNVDNTRTMAFNCKADFDAKKAAIYWGTAWLTGEYLEKINSGEIEFSPSPKLENTDKYYVDGRVDGYWIAENAPNLPGAKAFCSVVRYMLTDEKYGELDRKESLEKGLALNDEAYELVKEMDSDKFTQVNYVHPAIGNWGDNGNFSLWGDLACWNYPWSTCVENYYPILDEQINSVNN